MQKDELEKRAKIFWKVYHEIANLVGQGKVLTHKELYKSYDEGNFESYLHDCIVGASSVFTDTILYKGVSFPLISVNCGSVPFELVPCPRKMLWSIFPSRHGFFMPKKDIRVFKQGPRGFVACDDLQTYLFDLNKLSALHRYAWISDFITQKNYDHLLAKNGFGSLVNNLLNNMAPSGFRGQTKELFELAVLDHTLVQQ